MPQPMEKVKMGEPVHFRRLPASACPMCPRGYPTEKQLVAHVTTDHGIVALMRQAQGREWW